MAKYCLPIHQKKNIHQFPVFKCLCLDIIKIAHFEIKLLNQCLILLLEKYHVFQKNIILRAHLCPYNNGVIIKDKDNYVQGNFNTDLILLGKIYLY